MLRVIKYFAKSLSVTQDHSKMAPLESLGTVYYLQDIGRKSRFFVLLLHSTASLRGSPSEYCYTVCYGKLEWYGYPMVKKV